MWTVVSQEPGRRQCLTRGRGGRHDGCDQLACQLKCHAEVIEPRDITHHILEVAHTIPPFTCSKDQTALLDSDGSPYPSHCMKALDRSMRAETPHVVTTW